MVINPSLLRALFTPGGNLFAILDGAVVPGILGNLHQYTPEHVCLYRVVGCGDEGTASIEKERVRMRKWSQW